MVNYINIDNNYFGLSKYPVFLTPEHSLKKMKKLKAINLHFVKNNIKSDSLYHFDLIEF